MGDARESVLQEVLLTSELRQDCSLSTVLILVVSVDSHPHCNRRLFLAIHWYSSLWDWPTWELESLISTV
jgi:hypothetical protein